MLAVERTHRLTADRDWLPAKIRRTRTFVTGAAWVGTGAATAGAAVLSLPAAVALWKVLLLGSAGIAVAGNRAGHLLLQRQLQRMASGEIELAEVHARGEGELVVVRGTVQVEQPLRGVLIDALGVYRRLEFKVGRRWVHEAAVNFSLVDDRGERIVIEAAGARWLVPPRERVSYPAARFQTDDTPRRLRDLTSGRESVEAFEQVLGAGERIQVVGYKTTSADATGVVIDYRAPPQRATLRSGPELPLIVTRLADLEG